MTPTRYAVGFSGHPVAAHAVGEAIGQVSERLAETPDTVVVFVSAEHIQHFDAITKSIQAALQPEAMIAGTASGVIAGGIENERGPALSIWAGVGLDAHAHRIDALATSSGTLVTGLDDLVGASGALMLLGDPFTLNPADVLPALGTDAPGLSIVGGFASAASSPGGNRFSINGETHSSGAVALHFPTLGTDNVLVSQGCRPVGDPFIVTKAERNHIIELGGRPAIERLRAVIEHLDGLLIGIVFDESDVDFSQGDFLIRGILGTDVASGAVAINELITVGTTVQFQVRDPGSSADELQSLLSASDPNTQSVLAFNCTARGVSMFRQPNHDAELIEDYLSMPQVAGMFCAGEFGPVRGRNHLHTFTTSLLLLP